MAVEIIQGDAVARLREMEPDSFHACVTDPPYHLTSIVKRFGSENAAPAKSDGATGVYARSSKGFMGKQWDGGDVAFRPETWAAVYRVLKPGAYLLAFGGTRTWHRMACAIDDAGFEIRDTIMWLYGSGFPKSHDVSKAIDRLVGAQGEFVPSGDAVRRLRPGADQNRDGSWEKLDDRFYQPGVYSPATEAARQWQGWGTALKPACEPIVVARKPLSEGTVAANVLKHGTGALNVDACRVPTGESLDGGKTRADYAGCKDGWRRPFQDDAAQMAARAEIEAAKVRRAEMLGRWPANVAHDGSPEVMAAFARFRSESAGHHPARRNGKSMWAGDGGGLNGNSGPEAWTDTGTTARFFFCAKADASERVGSHPTVKPVALMEWLVQLVTPPAGRVLDPFCGTGSTLVACDRLGFDAVGIEQDAQTVADAHEKIRRFRSRRYIGDAPRIERSEGQLGLFDEAGEGATAATPPGAAP